MKIELTVTNDTGYKHGTVVFDTFAKLTAWAATKARDEDNRRIQQARALVSPTTAPTGEQKP